MTATTPVRVEDEARGEAEPLLLLAFGDGELPPVEEDLVTVATLVGAFEPVGDAEALPVVEAPEAVVEAPGVVLPPIATVGAVIKLASVLLKVPVIPDKVNLAEKPSKGAPLTW